MSSQTNTLCSRCWRPQLPCTIRICLGWSYSQGGFWRAMETQDPFSALLFLISLSGYEMVTATGLKTAGMGETCWTVLLGSLGHRPSAWPYTALTGLNSSPSGSLKRGSISDSSLGWQTALDQGVFPHRIPKCEVQSLSSTLTAPPPFLCPDCSLRKRSQRSETLPCGTF